MWSNLADYVKDSVVQFTRAVQAHAPGHNNEPLLRARRSSFSMDRWSSELKIALDARTVEPSLLTSLGRRGFPEDFRTTVPFT